MKRILVVLPFLFLCLIIVWVIALRCHEATENCRKLEREVVIEQIGINSFIGYGQEIHTTKGTHIHEFYYVQIENKIQKLDPFYKIEINEKEIASGLLRIYRDKCVWMLGSNGKYEIDVPFGKSSINIDDGFRSRGK